MDDTKDVEKDEEIESNSVFRDVRENLKPPIEDKV